MLKQIFYFLSVLGLLTAFPMQKNEDGTDGLKKPSMQMCETNEDCDEGHVCGSLPFALYLGDEWEGINLCMSEEKQSKMENMEAPSFDKPQGDNSQLEMSRTNITKPEMAEEVNVTEIIDQIADRILSKVFSRMNSSMDGMSDKMQQRGESMDGMSDKMQQRGDSMDGMSDKKQQRGDSMDGMSDKKQQGGKPMDGMSMNKMPQGKDEEVNMEPPAMLEKTGINIMGEPKGNSETAPDQRPMREDGTEPNMDKEERSLDKLIEMLNEKKENNDGEGINIELLEALQEYLQSK